MQSYTVLIARILMALVFLMSGFGKLIHFQETRQYMASFGMPAVSFFLVSASVVEILGGVCIVLGYCSRWAAAALCVFLVITTAVFHGDWSDQTQVVQVLKNLAILGGLLMIWAYGPGRISWEE